MLVIVVLSCAPIILAFSESQMPATLSPEDRELVATALGNAEWATANGVLIESTAPICKSVVAFCISRGLFESDGIKWDFHDSAQVRQAFIARNQQALEIGTLSLKLKAVRRAQIEQMFARGRRGWADVRQMYPHVRSIVQVSAPSYSTDGRYGLIVVESLCDGRCGGGALLLFERTSGRWALSRSLINWIG